MMNNLLNATIIVVLVGTVVLAPTPQPLPASMAGKPTETAAALPGIDEVAAKAAIEACGYGEVSALAKAADGTWRATGYAGTTEVRLTVNTTGRVLAD